MMKQSLVVLVIFGLLLTVATANLNNNERRILGGRKAAPQGWRWLSDRQEQDRVFFIVQLRDHSNGEVQQWISATLEAVSSPQSERYGQYLSYEQVAAQVSPPEDYFAAVEAWLSSHGIVHSLGRPGGFDQVVRRLNSLHVSTDVVKAESLLHTSFARFVSLVDADKVVVRQLGDFSIPAALNPFVDHIFGLSEFLPVRSKDHFLRDVTEQLRAHLSKHDPASTAKIQLPPVVYNGSNTFVTPDTIRNYYGIPLDQRSTTIQSAFADDQWFDASALNAFCTDNALPNTTCGVSHYVGWNCLASPLYAKLCANLEDEAQLDVQTLTGVASTLPGSAGGTWFWQVLSSAQEFLTESLWILVWAQQVNAQTGNNVPLVHSVSYGFPEVLQCLVGSYKCSTLGYDAEQYVSATDQQLQLFGIRGWTVLVSSGDDAAQGFAQNFPVTPASNTVNQLIIDNGVFQCMFPSGADSNVECSQILRKDGTGNTTEQGVPCLTAWTQYTSSPNQYVPQCSPRFVNPLMQVEIQNGTIIVPTMTSSCSTSQYPETVISGCRIRPWVYDPANGQPFFPDYPTSSPWVTSVGATQFYCDAAADGSCAGPTYEVVASSSTGALITSGGGFSLFHSMPYWQAPVVNQYLATAQLPPAGTFNATGRAYPDISLNGHMYLVILAVKGSPAVAAVDGTSASAPALAAMLTLWNSALAAAGKPSLGFFNPLLYTMYAENPSLFNDITQGDIACVRYTVGVCSQWTFYAQKGYDVASGVGTPRFLQVQNYLLSN